MTIEHNEGCVTVKLISQGGIVVDLVARGGITGTLAPVCATNLEPHDIPVGALCTANGIPFITSDGYYLIVAQS